jgi:SAM-dependent methyltransferase
MNRSLPSIGYAKRKTQELGITNIEYAQADILKLDNLPRTFDIIESVGVLHHMAEPFAGWRTLLSRLRPGGFMGLGFYSEVARRHIVRAREIIAKLGYAGTSDDIRQFRQDPVFQANGELCSLSMSADFYSTSECRDLLFHVQEQRLTLDPDRIVCQRSRSPLCRLRVGSSNPESIPRVLFRRRVRH